MTDTAPPPAPLAPYVTGPEVVAHLGGAVPEAVAESIAYAATAAVFQVVADPGWDPTATPEPVPVPEGVRRVTLMVAADIYKAGAAVGGEFQLDPYQSVPVAITSNLVRRYGAMVAPWARTTGMVG